MAWDALVHMAWVACRSGKAPLTLNDISRSGCNICCHPDIFFREGRVYFRKTMLKRISACITAAWLPSRRCLDVKLACMPSKPVIYSKHLTHFEMKMMTHKTLNYRAAEILYQKRMGQHFNFTLTTTVILKHL